MENKIKKIEIENFLNNYNYEIEFENDINIVIGKNGCGKTTILEMLVNLKKLNLDYFFGIPFSNFLIELNDGKKYSVNKSKDEVKIKKIVNNKEEIIKCLKKEEKQNKNNFEEEFNRWEYREVKYKYARWDNIKEEETEEKREKIEELKVDLIPLTRAHDFFYENNDEKLKLSKLFLSIKNDHIKAMENYSKENEKFKENVIMLPFYSNLNRASILDKISETIEFSAIKAKKILEIYEEVVGESEIEKVRNEVERILEARKKLLEVFPEFFEKEDILSKLDYITTHELKIEIYDMVLNVPNTYLIKSIGDSATELLSKKVKIFEKFRKIEEILNLFFSTGDKKVIIDKKGELKVIYKSRIINIEKLSSGEKQLITLFTYVVLKSYENNNQIFMIDEPELSLHLNWQKKFVDALKKINGKNQYIIATHSPEIIGKYFKNVKVIGKEGRI